VCLRYWNYAVSQQHRVFEWSVYDEIDWGNDIQVFGSSSYFVSSYPTHPQYYRIDLWEEGLSLNVMETMLPFQINCSQMYSSKDSNWGEVSWEILLLSPQNEVIGVHKPPEFDAAREWKRADYTFQFKSTDATLLKQFELRYVIFIIAARWIQYMYILCAITLQQL